MDGKATSEKIEEYIRRSLKESGRSGIIMGLSGGVDSALLAALAVRALGKEKVTVYFLHDKNSEPDSLDKAHLIAGRLGLKLNLGSIEKTMREKEKNAAFFKWISGMPKSLIPIIAGMYFIVVGETPYVTVLRKNEIKKNRFKKWVYDHIMKGVEEMFDGPCETRRIVLQKIADENNLLLIGAGNKSEDMTGWFTVKGVDNMPCSPIACLYKTQVRELAVYLDIPNVVSKRAPSADVLKGANDALALGMDFGKIDIILHGIEKGLEDVDIVQYGVSIPQIKRVRQIHKLSEWRRAAPKQ